MSHSTESTDNTSTKPDTISKYLTGYGEAEAEQFPICPKEISTTRHVLVIPAYQENLKDITEVFSHLKDVTVVLVVNSTISNERETKNLLMDIESQWQCLTANEQMGWFIPPSGQPVLVVDRVTHPIDSSQGVGLARKIGADIALALIHSKQVSVPMIFTTDADAILPVDYFETETSHPDQAFQLFPFQHNISNDVSMALYQFSLVWYPLGLNYAGSRYGFPSIGSTIAISADAYAKVRGYPRRSAGEDFYLLNKLTKIGGYSYANSKPIGLSNRRSERVPFGTGPGLRKIDKLTDPLSYRFYHPEVYVELKQFLNLLHTSYESRNLAEHFGSDVFAEFVRQHKLLPLLKRQREQTKPVFDKFLHDWFDGFRTLKFIHFVRDHLHPPVTYGALWQSEVLPDLCPGFSSAQVEQGFQLAWRKLTTS